MKLVIQIPCFNEADQIIRTLNDLPKHLQGIDLIDILIIDDGSTDMTSVVAHQWGVKSIVRLPTHQGLAKAFAIGLEHAVANGADIIVNTDADNQYKGSDIALLIEPIVNQYADIVIGNRNIDRIDDFSLIKKYLQRVGSYTVQCLSGLNIPDATTGFRAYSRKAALSLNVYTEFSYTLETIIAAGNKGMVVSNIYIETNPSRRPSRLHHSTFEYLKKQVVTLIRVYVMYRPFKFFLSLGITLFILGAILGLRYCYFLYVNNNPSGHIQSLILTAVFLILGFQMIVLGLIADLLAVNRRSNEEILSRLKENSNATKGVKQ